MVNRNQKSAMRAATNGHRARNTGRRHMVLGAACTVVDLLAGSSAYADSADAAADSDHLVEITVTAQRRVENAQKVPISVAPITPDAALNAGAVSTDQLAQLVPGVQMGHEINAATTFIRGIGPNSNGTGEESSVAVYLDEIYIADRRCVHFSAERHVRHRCSQRPAGNSVRPQRDRAASFRSTPRIRHSTPAPISKAATATTARLPAILYATGKVIDNVLRPTWRFTSTTSSLAGATMSSTGQTAFTAEDWGVRNKWLWTPSSSTRILLAGNFASTRSEVGLGFNQISQFIAAGGHGYCPGEGGDDGNPQTSPVALQLPWRAGSHLCRVVQHVRHHRMTSPSTSTPPSS